MFSRFDKARQDEADCPGCAAKAKLMLTEASIQQLNATAAAVKRQKEQNDLLLKVESLTECIKIQAKNGALPESRKYFFGEYNINQGKDSCWFPSRQKYKGTEEGANQTLKVLTEYLPADRLKVECKLKNGYGNRPTKRCKIIFDMS